MLRLWRRSPSAGSGAARGTAGSGELAHIDKNRGCSPNANHLHSRPTAMAVQIINDMPDAEVHRGEPFARSLHELNGPRVSSVRLSGRAVIVAITIALHIVGALAFMRMGYGKIAAEQAPPIEASLLDEAPPADAPPPQYAPPPMDVVYSLPTPDPVVMDTE